MKHTATITTIDGAGAPADIAPRACYITIAAAAAAERTGSTPWQNRELVEGGQLSVVIFNGRLHVSAAEVAAVG